MSGVWDSALAQCEARLDAASAALEHRTRNGVAPFDESTVGGVTHEPLPIELTDRARACVVRGDELSEKLATELERIRVELRRLPRMPRTQGETRFQAQA